MSRFARTPAETTADIRTTATVTRIANLHIGFILGSDKQMNEMPANRSCSDFSSHTHRERDITSGRMTHQIRLLLMSFSEIKDSTYLFS